MKTECEECQSRVLLDTEDADGVLIGGECPKCGHYVTRYLPGQEPKDIVTPTPNPFRRTRSW